MQKTPQTCEDNIMPLNNYWVTEEVKEKILKIPESEVKVKVTQSCLTLWDPMDYTVHGILQARTLEWVAYPFSSESS